MDVLNIINSISIAVKLAINEKWGDDFDRAHNGWFRQMKKSVNNYYNSHKYKAILYSATTKGDSYRDILVSRDMNTKKIYGKERFGLTVVGRKKNENEIIKGHFRVGVDRDDFNIFTDDNVDFLVFVIFEDTEMYEAYVLPKSIVKDVYDELVKANSKIKVSKKQKIVDNYGNFIAPLKGTDGVCVSVDFIRANAIDKFTLWDF